MRAGKVGAQHGVPVFEFHPQGERVAGDGGVVHQDVQLAEFREDLLEAAFYLRGVGYVHGTASAVPPAASISVTSALLVFRYCGRLRATFAPAASERKCGGAADALRCAGDESDFVFE